MTWLFRIITGNFFDYLVHYHVLSFRTVTGDMSEEQILLAGQLYVERSTVLENVLNDLFQIFRTESCQNLKLALEVLLNAMERHTKEKHIQGRAY